MSSRNEFIKINRRSLMKGTVLILIGVLISSCYFVAADNIGNQNYPTAYNSGGPSGGYDYLIFTFTNNTGTYYAAKDSFGRVVDSWTSNNDQTVFDNVVAVANASVVVASGTYTATIEVPTGMQLTLNTGVSGVTYTVASGANCTVNDYPQSKTLMFEHGAVIGGSENVKLQVEKARISTNSSSALTPYVFRTPAGYVNDPYNALFSTPYVVDNTRDRIMRINNNGDIENVAHFDASLGTVIKVYANRAGAYVLYSSDNNAYYYYLSAAQIEANNTQAVIADVSGGLEVNSAFWTQTNRSYPNDYLFVWAEYSTASPPYDVRIMRMDKAGTVTTLLTLNDTVTRHFHFVQGDPYNDGTFYAGTGDSDAKSIMYKSEDYGDTWTQVASGSQMYRAVNVNFDADYVYWATDGCVDGHYHFVRAPKSDLTDYEILFSYPLSLGAGTDGIISYGITKTFYPHGFLISVRTPTSASMQFLPMYWYSLEDGYTYKVATLETTANNAGMGYMPAYQNLETGLIYCEFRYIANQDVNYLASSTHGLLVGLRLTKS